MPWRRWRLALQVAVGLMEDILPPSAAARPTPQTASDLASRGVSQYGPWGREGSGLA